MKRHNLYRMINGKRVHVNFLASQSRLNTVNNCTIPKPSGKVIKKKVKWGEIDVVEGSADWKIPEKSIALASGKKVIISGFKQPKMLRKKYKKKYYNKGRGSAWAVPTIRKIVTHPSDYDQFPSLTFRPKGRAWYMEQVVQHKIAKWERKNPCPIQDQDTQPDIFEQEFVVPWKAKREIALERIRNFVVSVYDKLPLNGRFKMGTSKEVYREEKVAEIKDINGEGHKVNELGKDSKLLKKAQKITNTVHAKQPNLICTNLKDHKRKKGRIILPQAA